MSLIRISPFFFFGLTHPLNYNYQFLSTSPNPTPFLFIILKIFYLEMPTSFLAAIVCRIVLHNYQLACIHKSRAKAQPHACVIEKREFSSDGNLTFLPYRPSSTIQFVDSTYITFKITHNIFIQSQSQSQSNTGHTFMKNSYSDSK